MSVVSQMLAHGDSAAIYSHRCTDCNAEWENGKARSTCRPCEKRLRYVVTEVWIDGNPDDLSRHEELQDALDHRDELRKQRPCGRTGPTFFVHDAEDPERGWLDVDDLYETEAA